RAVALSGAGLLFMITVQAQAHTAPVMPGQACQGVACVEQLKNSKALAENMAALRLEWMKNPTSLFLDGETKLACECALCLAAGTHAPKECQAALAKYYLIQASSPFHTMALRQNFLLRCPKK
ncbi:MAG: TrbM/KikA/MpfK family conjugal transfer protein, partial [Nitrospirota bacterium]